MTKIWVVYLAAIIITAAVVPMSAESRAPVALSGLYRIHDGNTG